MRYYTHFVFAFLVGLLLIKILSISNQILFMMVLLFFSFLPDIDESHSKISQKAKPLGWIINLLLGHRGIVHSLWVPIALYLALFWIRMDVAIAASLGYVSHLVMDCCTVSGLKLFWPFPKKVKGFITTGSLAEHALFIGFVVLDVYLLFRL